MRLLSITTASRRHLRWAWLAFLAAVIAGSLLPATSTPIVLLNRTGISDKLVHFGAYAVLGFLPVLYESRRGALFSAITSVGIGILLEYGQLFTGRDFDVRDMLADGAGVLVGLAVGLALRLASEHSPPG